MRGQISFEYLVIVALAMLIIIPALLFFISYSKSGGDSVNHGRINDIGLKMLSTALDTYAQGRHAWLTLDVNMPDNIGGVYVTNDNELVLTYNTQHGVTSAVFFPKVTITNASDNIITDKPALNLIANGRPGIMSFRFLSQGNNISVSEVS